MNDPRGLQSPQEQHETKDNGPRLESVQKGSPRSVRSRSQKGKGMATLEQKSRSRAARQDRGSCSSTASCPVFSGSYSDHEEEHQMRRQSSPLIKASLTSLISSISSSKKSSLSSVPGSLPCLQASLLSFQGPASNVRRSSTNNKDSVTQMRRRSLATLDDYSPVTRDRHVSPSLQSHNGSSSDDDGSWDTNSWSSVATCLFRNPMKKDTKEETNGSKPEEEVVYQNLIFSQPGGKKECSNDSFLERTCIQPNKDSRIKKVSKTLSRNIPSKSSQDQDEKNEDRRKFSQFLNEVTGRVVKFNGTVASDQQHSTLHHWPPTPPPPPPSTPSEPLRHPAPKKTSAPGTPATNLWSSPTSSNIRTVKDQNLNDFTSSIHQWTQTLPSCKILEPEDVLGKVGSCPSLEQNLQPCTQIKSQSSTGRLYLETDIDRVRKLDELVANGTLGKHRKEKLQDRSIKMANKTETRIPWERNGSVGLENEMGRKCNQWEMDRRDFDVKVKDKVGESSCWGKEGQLQRGREKKKVSPSNDTLPPVPVLVPGRWNKPCPVRPEREGCPWTSFGSSSLPRSVNIIEADGDLPLHNSSFHDHKDELRKRLSFTAHKLEMVEAEFDSTRLYLETELRRAKDELDKFTEKLRRIQSSYSALQRINQDLEEKMLRTSQHHEDEKRALSREILLLNNHVMEAKITVNKLREDNDLYRKDCNLAAQLLHCSKSHYRTHKMSELPLDFQERISSHLEKHSQSSGVTMAMCHSNYSDTVPTTIIAQVLEKPEPGSGCPLTRSPSPQTQEVDSLCGRGSTDQLNRRVAYKTSDLYCSDTALYCPERWQETDRRQSVDLHGTALLQLHAQNSTDSNPDEEEAFPSGNFSHHEPPSSFQHLEEFGNCSLPFSSSYSSFSLASDDKGGVPGGEGGRTAMSTLSSSHQGLYTDWREGSCGDYGQKSMSLYDKDSPRFSKSHSIQHMVTPKSPQMGSSPAYTRTASCFSEPYHSSTPRLASSHSMGSTTGLAQTQHGAVDSRGSAEDELSRRWKQLSVEDINTFSSSYQNIPGRSSPYSFSEQHFAMAPPSKLKGALYSSFQEGDDVFHSRAFTVSSPSRGHSPKPKEHHKLDKASVLYRAKNDSQDSECGLFLSASSKDKESSEGASAPSVPKKDYVNLSVDSSPESLHQSSLEASSLQHYPSPRPSVRPRPSSSSALCVGPALPKKTSPRYQKFGSTGLTRKDSLTKAQLYGTLLN